MNAKTEKVIEWIARIILLPLGLIFGWYALKEFLSIPSEEAISFATGTNVLNLFLAGLLLYAAIYPAPPWRNEPLKTFSLVIVILLLVAVWWAGTVVGAGFIILFVLGKNVPLYNLVLLITIILLLVVQYILFDRARALLRRYNDIEAFRFIRIPTSTRRRYVHETHPCDGSANDCCTDARLEPDK